MTKMCGICGYFSKKEKITQTKVIMDMSNLMKHRGPDDQGVELLDVYGNGNQLAVAHNRLSIRDVSQNGHQPMFDSDKEICIVYNGEVYNVDKYRADLIACGVNFVSTSDTEVILYLYKQYGIDEMLKKIDGMFAIFIADMRNKKSYLIRDRVGVKPLYYYQNDFTFMFSSEMKSFYAHPYFYNELNTDVLTEYFMFRYVSGKENLLKDVYTLLPGHYLEIQSDYSINDVKYWDITDIKSEKKYSYQKIEDIITQSIKDRLVSDVKVGVQLSGGVDSSVVTAKIAEMANEDLLESFSIIFENYNDKDGQFSEKEWIDQVISERQICNNEYVLSSDKFYDLFSSTIWHLDLPMSIPNSVGIYYICKKACEKGVKVLVTGEGADELMGGYWRYSKYLFSKKHPLLQMIFDKLLNRKSVTYSDESEKMIYSSSWIAPDDISNIINDSDKDRVYEKRKKILDETKSDDQTVKFLNYEISTYLQDILNRQDKMSMAASVETRVPYLGLNVINGIRGQKVNRYLKSGYMSWDVSKNTKIPLKRISKKYFGKAFTYRNKSGFGLPMRDFLLNEKMSKYVESNILPYLEKQGVIKYENILHKWNNREKEDYKNISDLWIAITFGEWCRIFLGDKTNVTDFGKVI